MKENDNIEIPQRGRPKKNNADSSYSYTKILETDKTYNYNNQIFENQYELEQCEPFIKPFSETQGFDGPRTYDPRMHESLYEQEYENTNDSYMYAQRPYENVEQDQYLHMDPDIHNRNVSRQYENVEEQYGHIDPRSQNDNTQRPFDDIEQQQYMHMDPRMQNGPRQYESIDQQYMHVDPGLQHDSTQGPYENTEEQQYMHMDPRLQIDSTQRPYENIEQRQYIDPGLPKTNQQRQVNFYAENPSSYCDYNKLEASDSSFKNNRSIFKSPVSQNYSTIDTFEDDRIINKRKEQKNIYSYADHFMNAGWMNRKKRKNNPFIWQYLKNTEHPQIIPPSEYSSVDYVNSLDKSGQKMYLGTMKRPSYVEKAVSNNTILPLFLNNSNYYETSTSKQEFEKIAKAFMSKTEGLNYENVTVQQLKILMKEFGLSHTGKKQELIERVKQTANLIYDKIRNKGGVVDMDSKPANKKEYDVKPASGMDNETQGFDYLFFDI